MYVFQATLYQFRWWTPLCFYCCKEIRNLRGLNTRRSPVTGFLFSFLVISMSYSEVNCIIILLSDYFLIDCVLPHYWMYCRAGPSLSAYNYDSAYGKRALMAMYRGIMEQVLIILFGYCHVRSKSCLINFVWTKI